MNTGHWPLGHRRVYLPDGFVEVSPAGSIEWHATLRLDSSGRLPQPFVKTGVWRFLVTDWKHKTMAIIDNCEVG